MENPFQIDREARHADEDEDVEDTTDDSETVENDTDDAENDSESYPSFGNIMPEHEFRDACVKYAEWAIDFYDLFEDITFHTVGVETSTQMKRAAGKAGKKSASDSEFFMRFAYRAYEKWGWSEEIKETIRHELIHILQYQTQGTGNHGQQFKRMADEVDAPRHCKRFTDYKYGIFCSECDDMVTGKYRACKKTRNAERYQSKCCSASCYSEKL